ncbi:MAG TPA: phenylalanine--tRNA ligase beta subunit-related protein [Thermoanaerobaculia bacterium]
MTSLRISSAIFDAFPDVLVGVVAFQGVRNAGESAELAELLRTEEDDAVRRLTGAGAPIPEHPHVAPWREAYRKFGAKPKDHPSSIENLLRRVVKGHRLPHVNRLVDLYNAVSLRHFVPVGGEDLDAVEGDVELRYATDSEPGVRLLGEPAESSRPPKPGEVIYADRAGALCRRWNWKEADRTKLTEATTRGFLVVEGLPPVDRPRIDAALAGLAALVGAHCGGIQRTFVLDRNRREAPID